MKIDTKKDGNSLLINLEGRLDTNTFQDLEKETDNLDGIKKITFNFEKLDYISSAGLRVLLTCQKKMNNLSGFMIIKNVKEEIQEVFDMTGFSDILTIE
ncbi:MAG: STAS domain-containing protein [Bacilli bacterium]|nr:STAS domain-containing protein [Bacilli bacterium]